MEPEPTTSTAPGRSCASCQAPLERHQDWCLECGTAAPGRLAAARPGWRTVGTTLGLTLVLLGGAGAASYAALSSDANREAIASVPADATPVAQAPPAVPAPAAPVTPAPAVDAPPVSVDTPSGALPKAPRVSEVPASPVASSSASPKAETPASPSTSSDKTPAPKPRGKGTSVAGSDNEPSTPAAPIALAAGSVSVYDPYDRAVSPGGTGPAYDGDAGTSFKLTATGEDGDLQVGLVVDLQERKGVRGVELSTGSQGGRLEVYATDSAALPADILDTRWDHPASKRDLSGTVRAMFPKGGANYRYVTFWFTVPPAGSRTVAVKELRLLG